jgi:anti-sigma factor RsiW
MDLSEHVSQDASERYAVENLPESEIEPLEMHLLVCETCQDRLKHFDQFIAALRAAARKIAREGSPQTGFLTAIARQPGSESTGVGDHWGQRQAFGLGISPFTFRIWT